jgi:peroxiredoxin
MKPTIPFLILIALVLFSAHAAAVFAAEYTGQFDTTLVANVEDDERVIFKFDAGERLKSAATFDSTTHIAMGKLQDPQTKQYSVLSFLVEEKGKEPVLYADLNDDHLIAADEKYVLKRGVDDTYIWAATVLLKVRDNGMFKLCPIFVRYFKNYTAARMGPEDRLVLQSTEAMARAKVNVKGKDVLFQYGYSFLEKKIDPQNAWLGVDSDGDGEIDMDDLSPESAKADKETVVFRVGDMYVSTKKADVGANQVVIREHSASEYKRAELHMNKPFPDFSYTDFDGKKHRFSEFRGKYVLLDVWGFWCPACREELPYIREANRRFASRNLQVFGLNTDDEYSGIDVKGTMKSNQMIWPQAQLSSIRELLSTNLRIHSFPATFLISPDGNILSMSRSRRDEPDLRGKDLLTTLDEILPKQ